MIRILLALLLISFATPAFAAQKQIGTACSNDAGALDWDAVAQCNGTTFVKGPVMLGAVAAPPYSATTCDGTKAGMIQWTGTAFQGCDGSNWVTFSTGSGSAVPTGTIVMWSGSIATIPSGWALCNGSNGTPDLRSRFIVGAGADGGTHTAGSNGIGTGYYAPGASGGEDTHVLTTPQMPNHSHTVPNSTYFVPSSAESYGVYGYTSGTTSSSSVGGGGAHENRPPYYALAYIMKL